MRTKLLPFALLALGLVGAARAEEDRPPLELANGEKYVQSVVYTLPKAENLNVPERCWVVVAGESFRAAPRREKTAAYNPDPSKFLQGAYVWGRSEDGKFLLLAEKDDKDRVKKALGWLPAESVISQLAASPIRDPDTSILRKAMIVNKVEDIKSLLEKPPQPLLELSSEDEKALEKKEAPDSLLKALKLDSAKVEKRPDGAGWLVLDAPKAKGEQEDAAVGRGVVRQWFDVTRNATTKKLEVRDSLNQAVILDRPDGKAGQRRRNFALFNVFYVYRETSEYALIGSVPQFEDKTMERDIHGWVRKDRLSFWNTAAAMEWDVRSTQPGAPTRRPPTGLILGKVSDAEKWLGALKTSDPVAAAALVNGGEFGETRDPDEKNCKDQSRPLRGSEMRFPVLGEEGKGKPGDQSEFEKKNGTKLYRVGAAGPLMGGGEASAAELAKRRERIEKVIEDLLTVEILFVIDGTGSVTGYYEQIQKTILQSLQGLKELQSVKGFEKLRVRVNFTFYGDGDSKPPVVVGKPFNPKDKPADNPAEIVVPRAVAGNATVEKRLKKLIETCVGEDKELRHRQDMKSDLDPLEFAYRGITEGIAGAGFGYSSTQWVILITDVGSDEKDTVTKADVVNALAGGSAVPKRFLVLHKKPQPLKPGDAERDAVLKLTTQVKAIKADMEKLGGTVEYTELTESTVKETTLKIGDLLASRLKDLQKELIEDLDTLGQYSAGGIPIIGKASLLKRLTRNDDDRLLHDKVVKLLVGGGVQVYQEGYLCEQVPVRVSGAKTKWVPQARQVFKVSEAEAKSLLAFYKGLANDNVLQSGTKEEFQKLVSALLSTLVNESGLTGQDWAAAQKSPAEFFKRVGGLPFKPSWLQAKDISQIPLPSLEQRRDLFRVAAALEELITNPSVENTWRVTLRDSPRGGGATYPTARTVGEPRKNIPAEFQRRYTDTLNGTVWLWLDAELHLPGEGMELVPNEGK